MFGNGKTAIKGSVGKYVQRDATAFASKYNPLTLSTDTRTWSGAVDAQGLFTRIATLAPVQALAVAHYGHSPGTSASKLACSPWRTISSSISALAW